MAESEMVERVAAAMCAERKAFWENGREFFNRTGIIPEGPDDITLFRRSARVAIEALREPTSRMAYDGGDAATVEPRKGQFEWEVSIGAEAAKTACQAMIDAALSPRIDGTIDSRTEEVKGLGEGSSTLTALKDYGQEPHTWGFGYGGSIPPKGLGEG